MKLILKSACAFVLSLTLLFATLGFSIEAHAANAGQPAVSTVSKVKLNRKTLTMTVGQKATLKTTLKCASAERVRWTSSKPRVARVSARGTVRAIGKGKTRITATTATGQKASCVVTVKAYKVGTQVPTTDAQAKKAIQIARNYALALGMTEDKSIRIEEAGYLNPPDMRILSQKSLINAMKYCLDQYFSYSPAKPSDVHFRILQKGSLIYVLYQ